MITAYIKPTNFCNVGCSHCFLTEESRAERERMSSEILEQTARFLKEMAEASGGRHVHVIWHGGEPLTVSPSWYRMAGDVLDRYLPGHTESMQTSLIPYRREFAELAKERWGGEIGSSIDFSARAIRGSNASYIDLWLQKVSEARADGISVFPGTVPSRGELGSAARLVDWFVSHAFRQFQVERYNAFGHTDIRRPSNAEHSAFLIELFDALMVRHAEGRAPAVGVVLAAVRGVLQQVPGDRWGGRCQSDFVVIEPSGHLNNCPDKATREPAYAHVRDGYQGFSRSSNRRHWIRLQSVGHRNPYCASCEFSNWCRSGCPITPQLGDEGEAECSGYKRFLSHVRDFCASADRRAVALSYLGVPSSPTAYLQANNVCAS